MNFNDCLIVTRSAAFLSSFLPFFHQPQDGTARPLKMWTLLCYRVKLIIDAMRPCIALPCIARVWEKCEHSTLHPHAGNLIMWNRRYSRTQVIPWKKGNKLVHDSIFETTIYLLTGQNSSSHPNPTGLVTGGYAGNNTESIQAGRGTNW